MIDIPLPREPLEITITGAPMPTLQAWIRQHAGLPAEEGDEALLLAFRAEHAAKPGEWEWCPANGDYREECSDWPHEVVGIEEAPNSMWSVPGYRWKHQVPNQQ